MHTANRQRLNAAYKQQLARKTAELPNRELFAALDLLLDSESQRLDDEALILKNKIETAAHWGNLEGVMFLLDLPLSKVDKHWLATRALYQAAAAGRYSIVDYLLKYWIGGFEHLKALRSALLLAKRGTHTAITARIELIVVAHDEAYELNIGIPRPAHSSPRPRMRM